MDGFGRKTALGLAILKEKQWVHTQEVVKNPTNHWDVTLLSDEAMFLLGAHCWVCAS